MVPRPANFVEQRNQSIHLPRGLFALFSASEDRLRVFDLHFAVAHRLRPAMVDSRVVFARQSVRLVYQNFRVLFQHKLANFDWILERARAEPSARIWRIRENWRLETMN